MIGTCKGVRWDDVFSLLACRQLRFSLYSRAVITKVLAIVVFLYYSLSLGLWEYPMPYASCLATSSIIQCCSSGQLILSLRSSPCPVVLCLMQLSLSGDLGFCSLFYLVHICTALWDSLSGLVDSGIACLASQAPDWTVVFWDSLSGLWLVTLW